MNNINIILSIIKDQITTLECVANIFNCILNVLWTLKMIKMILQTLWERYIWMFSERSETISNI